MHSMSYCFSKWHKNAFARTGPKAEPIATPSICLSMTWSKMKHDLYAAKVKSSLISLRSKLWIELVPHSKLSIQMLITPFKEILVNELSTSILAMKGAGQKLEISSAKENESCTKSSLTVRCDNIETKNLVSL